jgi:antitoxin YefM
MAAVSRILYSEAMSRTVPFTEARARLSELLDVVEREQEHVVITRKGKPVALLMSVDEWESWEETIEVLSDDELMESLRRADEDVKAGRLYTLDEVLKRLGLA